jgi:hypothetical protein
MTSVRLAPQQKKRLVRLALLLGVILLLLAVVRTLRSPEARAWYWQNTGEENAWEGFKGGLALALLEARRLTGPPRELAPDEPIDRLGLNPYGVNAFLQLEADPENVRRSFRLLSDAHLGWARQVFPWEDIESHARGDFEDRRNRPTVSAWDKYDRIVGLARDHGIQLLVRLDNPPDWAYADPAAAGEKGPPDDLEDYGRFVGEVVTRYCGQVRAYQIWNEPNIYPEWGERDVDPAGYAALLKVAAREARAACDDVVIVAAALAPNTEPGGRNMDDLKYLEALYDAGWQEDFDVLAVNAFGLWTGPTDRRTSPDRTNFGRVELAREIMVRHGDAAKPIWITEMGWDSPPEGMEAPYGRVSEENRARYTTLAFERMAREWPWIGVGFLWFLRRPDEEWHQRPEGYFRLVEPDWTQTPTYRALAELAARPAVMHRGRHSPLDRALITSGPWRNAPLAGPVRQRVGSRDAEVQLTFDGTGFQLFLAPPPEGRAPPRLYLILDGEPQAVTLEAVGDRLSYRRAGLESGEHVVIVRVDDGEAWLDEVRIEAPPPAWPFATATRRLVGWIALVVLGAVAFLLVRRAWRRSRPG